MTTPQITTLSNGFRIVTERMPSLLSASVGIWVTAGGRDEAPEQNGIAHFLEHMAFKGTEKRTTLEIAEAIEDVGGYINAYTSRETTAYYARVLGDDVALAIDVIGDILLNPVFDPAEIDVERHVILQEIGQALDTPDDVIFDWLQERAYPGQALGRTILGPPEQVSGFARTDLQRFVGQHYGPQNMILAAAGAVDHDAIVRQAETLFGAMAQGAPHIFEPARFSGGEIRQVKPLEQAHFALAFEAPDYRDPAIYTAQVYANALGGGMSSRLFQELRERRGLCYSVFAQASAYDDTGLISLYAGTGPDQIRELAELTMDELRRGAEGLAEAEIERARAQMKAGLLMGLEGPSGRAERLARQLAIWDRVPPLEETLARIEAVTAADLRDFAGRLIGGAGPALALLGPIGDAPDREALVRRLAA